MSAELVWSLVKKNNASLVKRNSHSQQFSKERFNVRNLHSYMNSGFVHARGVDIQDNNGKGVVLAVKSSKTSRVNKPATSSNKSLLKRSFRHGARTVTAVTGAVRPDQVAAAQGRFSRIKRVQTRKAGVYKRHPHVRHHRKPAKDCNVVG